MCRDDLIKLYESFDSGSEIRLWCEAKTKDSGHQNTADKDDEPRSKKQRSEEQETDIRAELEKKHGDKYTDPQYTLWAKLKVGGTTITTNLLPSR